MITQGVLQLQTQLRKHGLDGVCNIYSLRAKRHSIHENLVLFKYHQFESDLTSELVQCCRGIILDESDEWRVVSYPFDKFFNLGEPSAAQIDWPSALFYEKLDGSLLTLYAHTPDNAHFTTWYVSTTGTPDASAELHTPLSNGPKTFAQYFWQTWGDHKVEADPNYCYMFELTGPWNQIVVQHPTSSLRLLGARDLISFKELTPSEAWTKLGQPSHIRTVPWFDCLSLEEAKSALETMNGSENEGYVVCDQHFNRIKLKCPDYLLKHYTKSNGATQADLMGIIQRGEQEEWVSYFPEYTNAVETLDLAAECFIGRVVFDYQCILIDLQDGSTAKDFALAAQKKDYPAVMFGIRKLRVCKDSIYRCAWQYLKSLRPKQALELVTPFIEKNVV